MADIIVTPGSPLVVTINPPTVSPVIITAGGPAGPAGADGVDGAIGPQGPAGADGADGAPGVGVPAGGATGESLLKASDTDYDTEWASITQATGNELENVVEDTTPQLGGTLDSNGNSVQFRWSGHTNYIQVSPSPLEPIANATFFLPPADGTTGQVIQTNGSGRLSFVTRATEAYVDTAANTLTENTQTDTTYTTVLTDAGKMITCDNASAITVTIPPDSSVAYEAGTVLSFIQKGDGQVTLSDGGVVTLNNANGLKTASKYSVISCWKEDTDTWIVYGDTTA
jgi:hypothetical protein